MILDLFIVSAIYWGGILVVLLWLNRRLTVLKNQLSDLKGDHQNAN
jgi:hypothetical protein